MATSQRNSVQYLVFDWTTSWNANGASQAYLAEDFRNAVIEITASNPVSLTVKFVGSNLSNNSTTSLATAYPNFWAADSMTNPWTYLQSVDLNDWSSITGSTGITFTTAWTKEYEINLNQKRWVWMIISGYTSWSIKATITFTDNR